MGSRISSALLVDGSVALVVAFVQLVGGRGANLQESGVRSLDALGYVLLLAGPIALVLRRVRPYPVLLVTLLACVAYTAVGYGPGPIFLSLVIAFLTAAPRLPRVQTYPLVGVGYLLMVWPVPALFGHPVQVWPAFGILAWLLVLVGIAEAIRQRRAIAAARTQRAETERREIEFRQEQAAAEERLAIARELHDVLAHSLSLINVQSSVALELFDRKPDQAAAALATIKVTSKDALAEVSTLLQSIRAQATPAAPPVLPDRSQPEPEGTELPPAPAPRAPAPSIADLDALLQRVRDTGLTVQTRILGEPRDLPTVIDVAVARIIQESLTNVVRHAPGATATVAIRYTQNSIDVTVDNTRPAETATRGPGGGTGIIGMRERAHTLGGALTAGPRPTGGFRVAARLPLQKDPGQSGIFDAAPEPASPATP